MQISGSIAIVTGASRGIGREVALALARGGASVALVARDRAALAVVADAIGPERSLVLPADLSDLGQIPRIAAATLERFGRIDILVNNAAIVNSRDFLQTSVEEVARTVDVNFRATAVLTRLVAEAMAARRRGRIVTVASFAGVVGIPGGAVYAGTKAAERLFTASLRQELGEHGIGLTDVVLGTITTGMLDEVESNPRVRRYFDRFRRLGLLVDVPAPRVAQAIVRAIRRDEPVVVLPARGRYLVLPAQGLARQIGAWLAR